MSTVTKNFIFSPQGIRAGTASGTRWAKLKPLNQEQFSANLRENFSELDFKHEGNEVVVTATPGNCLTWQKSTDWEGKTKPLQLEELRFSIVSFAPFTKLIPLRAHIHAIYVDGKPLGKAPVVESPDRKTAAAARETVLLK